MGEIMSRAEFRRTAITVALILVAAALGAAAMSAFLVR
jgi:hypothetical protein